MGEVKAMTASEQKELRRVFDHLANFLAKKDIYAQLRPREERKAKLLAHKKNPDAVKIFSDDGEQVPESAIESELKELAESADTLQSQINEFDQNPNKKVRE